ncbi:MAG: tRNA1(Val) (adenine(37)-N6)-methyltransferase [Verrucomicrobiales bacterium]
MNFAEPIFKGWTKPGPIPPGALGHGPELEPGETLDSISGYFRLFQLTKGHRFSTDDVLVAWYGSCWASTARSVLDLGSGITTVASIAAWRLPAARIVSVEAQAESVRLARKSAAWNGLIERLEIREGDFRDATVFKEDERFDLVFGSPPYFPQGSGVAGDHPQKIACRFELRGDVADYCKVAVERLNPAGMFACVFPVTPEEQHARVIEGAKAANLTILRWRPVVFREGEPPLLGLFMMMRTVDLPHSMHGKTWEEPALTIRTKKGEVHPEYSAVKLSFGFPP